ncbi:Amidophosphoribosyltransferase [Beggiatoa sp. PS]|nr:Amidophosphoribosyltransferase [Beggiatoa sp. PS]
MLVQKKVYFASAAPAVRYPNVYGIDMPSVNELLAHNRNTEEIAEAIGADWLVYQDLEDLIACAHKGNKSIKQFDASCFTGQYITGDVDEEYLLYLDHYRNEAAKKARKKGEQTEVIDLYNVA